MILTLFIILFALVAVGLVFFVLLQTPKQAGLTASMASGGSLLGGRGVEGGLVRITSVLGGLFMLLALLIGVIS
ncbi:preprotein translocase subunit SecG [Deinococcus hopiensis]|uniref:Protein-export membrane protein SecG n=1 Tax=Deinococcus hopiensis KR-140 TaxID=695939 RepID=A0A1W1VLB7_9DEIO|nr:preprotein translocase subunit SecG [Deinococcus hopiensis]SMB93754.1 preprotein translocase subunit SecG [Deinococcus hopiensis KR-140]